MKKRIRPQILGLTSALGETSGDFALRRGSTDGFNVIDRGWPCQHLNKYLGFIFDLQKHRDMIGKIGGLYEYANRPR